MKCFYKIGQHILATDPAVNSKKVIGIPPGTRYYIDFSKGNYKTYMFQRKVLGNYLILFKYYYENSDSSVSSKKPIGVVLMDLSTGHTYHMDFVLALQHKFEVAFLPLDDYMILVAAIGNYDAGNRSVESFYYFVHLYYKGNPKLSFSIEHIIESIYKEKIYFKYDRCSPSFIILNLLYAQILENNLENIDIDWIATQTRQITIDFALGSGNAELFVIEPFGRSRIQETNAWNPRSIVYLNKEIEKNMLPTATLFYIDEQSKTAIRAAAGLTGYIYGTALKEVLRDISLDSDTGMSNYRLPDIKIKKEGCVEIKSMDFKYHMVTYDYKYVIEVLGNFCEVMFYRLQNGAFIKQDHESQCIKKVLKALGNVIYISSIVFVSSGFIILETITEEREKINSCYILLQLHSNYTGEKMCVYDIYNEIDMYTDKAIIGIRHRGSLDNMILLDLKTQKSFVLPSKYLLYDEKERIISQVLDQDVGRKIVMKIHRVLEDNATLKLVQEKVYHLLSNKDGIDILSDAPKFLIAHSRNMIALFSPLGLLCQLYFTLHLRLGHTKSFKTIPISDSERKYLSNLTNIVVTLSAMMPEPTIHYPDGIITIQLILSNLTDKIKVLAGVPLYHGQKLSALDNILISDSRLRVLVTEQKDKVFNVDLFLDLTKPQNKVITNLLVYDFTTQKHYERPVELKSTVLFSGKDKRMIAFSENSHRYIYEPSVLLNDTIVHKGYVSALRNLKYDLMPASQIIETDKKVKQGIISIYTEYDRTITI